MTAEERGLECCGGQESDGMGELSRGHYEPLRSGSTADDESGSQLTDRRACEDGFAQGKTDD